MRVGLSDPERALPGRYRVRPSRKREGDEKNATPKHVNEGFTLSLAHASGYQNECLVVGRTEDAIRAGTAQTPRLCRRDYAINDVSTCIRSSGNGRVCSVRPTPRTATPKLTHSRVGLPTSEGFTLSLAHAPGYHNAPELSGLLVGFDAEMMQHVFH